MNRQINLDLKQNSMTNQATQKDAYNLLHEGVLAFSRAEQQGIRIDLDYCRRAQKELTSQIKEIEKRFYKTKFFQHWNKATRGKPNINSNSQLGWFLYKVKKLKPAKTTVTGLGSTDEEALESLDIPEIKDLLRIRKLKKVRDTYLKGFIKEQVNGYIHPNFNLHTARTYRSSSSNPNFQNIPKRDKEAAEICRKALYPRPGFQLLEVDYSSIEVCISACYHKDPTMIKYIENPESDMHGDMAEQLFFLDKLDKSIPGHKTLRSAAKNGFVFPQFYGDYYGNNAVSLACTWGELPENRKWKSGQGVEIDAGLHLSDHLQSNGISFLKEYTDYVQEIESHFWKNRFPVYDKWKARWWKEYEKKGYIDMLTGFRCWGPMARNDATNYPIQGTAFHCLLWSFIRLDKILRKGKYRSRVIGQIHDAMVLDVHPDELPEVSALLQKVMVDELREYWKWIIVPLAIEIDLGGVDESWNELKPYKVAA